MLKQVEREEFAKFIKANPQLEGKPVSTEFVKPGVSAMQYVNDEGIVVAQAAYHGTLAKYELRQD